ncbi:hypothetical protein [Ammoniphilus resinae]|uniref:Uncharacterized protein n=1 Tax=Ammoniphilus resinae TaxID=861532 RepID=A0ABS4GNK8_9BACL|nr:hypothetical protein [Ammoniphilus resinae]MBP1931860.1 hypothetical protein [Ammoniphilus resinae]
MRRQYWYVLNDSGAPDEVSPYLISPNGSQRWVEGKETKTIPMGEGKGIPLANCP